MFKNNNGYVLLDLILSLTCLMIITMTFLPFLQDIMRSFQNSELRLLAEETLYEEMIKKENSEHFPHSYSVLNDGIQFELSFNIDEVHLFGCIEWVNSKLNSERMCLYEPNFNSE